MERRKYHSRNTILQILIPTIISIIFLISISFLTIFYVKNLLIKERKQKAKEMVNSVYNMINGYYLQVEQGLISEKDAKDIIKFNFKNLRYGSQSKDYFWLIDYNNNFISHPYYIDSITLQHANPEYQNTMSAMILLAQEHGEGFHEYNWQWKDDITRVEDKISFVKNFPQWEWVMGTGFYTKEVDDDISGLIKFLRIILVILILSILLLFLIILRRSYKNLNQLLKRENELVLSERRFKGMADNLNSGLVIQENETTIYANKLVSDIFGIESNNFKDFSIFEFVVSDEKERLKTVLNQKGNGDRNVEINFWILTKNNARKYINAKIAFENRNNNRYIYFLFSDKTKTKEIENHIRRLSQIVEQSPDSMVITDLEGKITYANQKFIDETGYSYEEAIGNKPNILKSGKMSPSIYEDLWQTITEGKVWKNELLNKKKNGELFWEDTIVFPIKDENSEIISYAAIKSDLTQHKQLEDELRKSKEEAQIGEKLKIAFLNNVSHEINTPLNAINGFSSLLKDKLNKEDKEYEQISYVLNHTEILIKMFNNIMLYSAIESGDIEIQRNEIGLNSLLSKISSEYKSKLNNELQKSIEIKIDIEEDFKHAVLISDIKWIEKIIEELVINSLKYTFEGSITLGYKIDYENITFYVKDTGVGIPENEQQLIFNSFTHGEKHYVSLHKGMGLGLNIARSLANNLGGVLWFASKEEQGTNFYFSLPSIDVKQYTLNNKRYDILPFSDLLKGKKVIVAEDNDFSFEHIKSMIINEVTEITRVKEGNELLNLFEQKTKSYDLILKNIFLPNSNNINSVLKLRKDNLNIPIIAMFSSDIHISEKIYNFYDALIAKPFSKRQLYEKLLEIFKKNEKQLN